MQATRSLVYRVVVDWGARLILIDTKMVDRAWSIDFDDGPCVSIPGVGRDSF